jgi:SdrD B-like protein
MNRVRIQAAAIGLFLCSLSAWAQVVTTVGATGAPRDVFADKDEVFFTAGPTATGCAFSQFVNDGRYVFQVTDLTGTRLLSTDPVTERVVTVRNGVILSADGPAHGHATADRGPCGGLSVGLAPFADAGNRDADYLLWLTPVASFDQACGAGCFHGFRPESSLTTHFRVEDKRFCEESFCVSGVKFEDRNGNGEQDSGEPGLPGVEIRVEGEHGPLLRGLTLGDGSFEVCGMHHGGSFRVTEGVPFGFRQTAPRDDRISRRLIAQGNGYFVLSCNSDFDGLNFGNQLIPNAIGGIKFEDLDADGVRDPGEPGLAGFTITLTSTAAGGPAPRTVVTDANGNFLFTDVAAGSYTLSETLRQGFSLTVPAANSLPVTLASGGTSINNTFGNFRGVLTGTISGTKFNDQNGNGIRDAGEPGLAGVSITRTGSINDPTGAPLSITTDASGNFSFTVPFGNYTLTETVPAGFAQTAPPAPGTIAATINFAQRTVSGLLFGNRPLTGTIGGLKFNDVNGNGVRDAGEPGLSGVTIRVIDAAGSVRTATTDATGAFSVTGLPAGAYVVSEIVPTGFVQTAPAAPGTFTQTLTAGQTVANLLFGNRAAVGMVTGNKFNDVNGNGVSDPGEPGLAGVTIRLTDASGVVRTTTTNASGAFSFSDVSPGNYVVSEVVPAGFVQTAPAAPGTIAITVAVGGNSSGLLFGNRASTSPSDTGSITGRKILDFNGNGILDAGDRGFEGIVFQLRDASGAIRSATSNANGDFTFSSLPAGTYVLTEVLPENFFQTFPGSPESPGSYTITITTGQTVTGFLFLNKC